MTKHWFKIKNAVMTILVVLISNAYLIYLLTQYVIDKTIASILVLLTNEIFMFIGILFYLFYDLKYKLDLQLQEQRYVLKSISKKYDKLKK